MVGAARRLHNRGMSYFTAVLNENGSTFKLVDIDVDDASSLDDLIDMMVNAGEGDGDSVAVVEHEDEWFAIVRLLPSDEIKVFISDIDAAAASPYAELFVDYLDSPKDEQYEEEDFAEEDFADSDDSDDEPEDDQDEDLEMLDFESDGDTGGDADIFADRGVDAAELLEQVEKYQSDPARIVAHIGEVVGFADSLEAAR